MMRVQLLSDTRQSGSTSASFRLGRGARDSMTHGSSKSSPIIMPSW